MTTIDCPSCGHSNEFAQPYPFHAGFSDQGFLYNDAGDLTLVWSAFDRDYVAIVGSNNPWALAEDQQQRMEHALRDAPSGGKWRFVNPARCGKCGVPISGPMSQTVYYLVYPNSVVTDLDPARRRLSDHIQPGPP